MTDKLFCSAIKYAIKKAFPDELNSKKSGELIAIWSSVLQEIIQTALDEFFRESENMHHDLKPEISVSFTNTAFGLASAIVKERANGKRFQNIDVDDERAYQASDAGRVKIRGTTETMLTVWRERYNLRWAPKTLKKLENEKNPPPPKPRKPKAVEENHFISKFLLRKYWAVGGKLTIMRREILGWSVRETSFGGWGKEAGLYSDRLEDRFQLIEGDAEAPLKKLLEVYPLNHTERLALLGYFIVQTMRTPAYRNAIIQGTLPVSIATVGHERAHDAKFQRDAYETIFEQNQLYHEISGPLLWAKWLVVRSTEPIFVLPDTFALMTRVVGRNIMIAPLTPTACFVTSGIEEQEKRALPFYVNDDELAAALSTCLLQSAQTEAACARAIRPPEKVAPANALLEAVLSIVDKAIERAESDEGD